jgi:hypothetical protein
MIGAGMGRSRFVWLLSLPLIAGAWLLAHQLMHAVAPARPEAAMASDGAPARPEAAMASDGAHHALSAAPLCAACAAMMMLLLVLLSARPAVALGYELAERVALVRVPRPPAWYAPSPRCAWLEPELARPPILATGHSGRAPPRPALGLA